MFTDTHCHIFINDYNNPEEIIKKAYQSGIKRIILSACNEKSSLEAINLANKYCFVYFTLGCHPSELYDLEKAIKIIEKNITNSKFLAIGEIGLDYHYEKYSREEQKRAFIRQIELAKKYNKKIVVHTRDAEDDTYNILNKSNIKGVIHSFNGDVLSAKKYIKLGFYLGINGIITFKNSNLKEVIKALSLEKILLETDSPYLTPAPYRGQKNEPSQIITIANFLSEFLNISLSDMALILEDNIKSVFDINL